MPQQSQGNRDEDLSPKAPVPAAQYIRMSTDHQQYSTENQKDVIRDYAQRRGYHIVKTYADEGKSGLRMEGRDALRQMIDDVQGGRAGYQAVLVYDVSRWGRFQDSDESAYYEYTCKRAGIRVIYCAEEFENDGSPVATIVKSVKRAMAGEYSRELSTKVFKGQCRLIELGYRQGGPAGFGLRRMLVDQSGQPKSELKRGEHKSLQTDRVILVPGPSDEVEGVRLIYRLFTKDGKWEREIAHILQERGIPSESGRPWTRAMVHEILTNEKYIGNNVFNRVSFKLKKKRVRNSPDMWIRSEGAFQPVIDQESFFVARGIIHERSRVFTEEELVGRLRDLFLRHNALSASLIDEADGASSSVYRHRFGSLIEAYRRAGYRPSRNYDFLHVNRRLRTLYPQLVDDTLRTLRETGASVVHDDDSDRLLINEQYSAAVVLTRCRRTCAGSLRWVIRLGETKAPDVTVVVRMDEANERPVDFYLLPLIDVSFSTLLLGEDNGVTLDTYRFDSLAYFFGMAARVRIEVAA